jgi:protein gp37
MIGHTARRRAHRRKAVHTMPFGAYLKRHINRIDLQEARLKRKRLKRLPGESDAAFMGRSIDDATRSLNAFVDALRELSGAKRVVSVQEIEQMVADKDLPSLNSSLSTGEGERGWGPERGWG